MKSSIEQWNPLVDSCHGSGSVREKSKNLVEKLHFFTLFDFSRRFQQRVEKFKSTVLCSLKRSIQWCQPLLESYSGWPVICKNRILRKKCRAGEVYAITPRKKIHWICFFFNRLKRPRILLSEPILFSLQSSIQRCYPLLASSHGQRVVKNGNFRKKSTFSVYRQFDSKSKIQGDSSRQLSFLSKMQKKSSQSVQPFRRSLLAKKSS